MNHLRTPMFDRSTLSESEVSEMEEIRSAFERIQADSERVRHHLFQLSKARGELRPATAFALMAVIEAMNLIWVEIGGEFETKHVHDSAKA